MRFVTIGRAVAKKGFDDLLAALARLPGDPDSARDVVQQTFCNAIERLESYRGEAALYTWFCQICRNVIADHFRRKGPGSQRVVLLEDQPNARAILEALAAPAVGGLGIPVACDGHEGAGSVLMQYAAVVLLFGLILAGAVGVLFFLCLILGVTSWTGLCRLLRGETLKLRELEYIQAAHGGNPIALRRCFHIVCHNSFLIKPQQGANNDRDQAIENPFKRGTFITI